MFGIVHKIIMINFTANCNIFIFAAGNSDIAVAYFENYIGVLQRNGRNTAARKRNFIFIRRIVKD